MLLSDNRGKVDAKIAKGVGGSTSNSIKELIGNEALSINNNWSKYPKMVLIMDEVDGMSAGDRGGVADLIASIKVSKIPIICICNDRYSQKLKSLVNYYMLLNFGKPTKQQMAKRLMQIAQAEGFQVNEIALEELAERVNGDMRMALNQLQYMSLCLSVIKYDEVRERLFSSTKDEDISPFTAIDKQTLRVDYLFLLLKQLTDPLRVMAKDAAVQNVVEFMNTYSLSQEDLETIMELSKFKGHPNPMDGIQPAVKAALTKAYKQGSSTRIVRTADLINLPGIKKAPKKRIAAILDPVENSLAGENGDALLENEDGSDSEEADVAIDQNVDARPQLDLQTDNRKGIQVQLDLKNEDGKSKGKSTSASKARGSGSSDKAGRGGSAGGKRKR